MRRTSILFTALTVAAIALAPALAEARAGFGGSFGSRGGRSYSAPPSTSTAPSYTAPLERSITPRPSAPYAPGYTSQPGFAPRPGGGFRSGLAGGLLGGLLGVGLGGLLTGHGFFGGGGFGFIGLLIQFALLFFIGRWVLGMVLGRSRPMMAGVPRMGQPAPMQGSFGGMATPASPPVQIGPDDYKAFASLLQQVQAAWSAQDITSLQRVATPEMVGVFGEQLAEQASRGVRNTVTDVNIEKGDLAEAWSEGNREYATVAMRFSMVDVTRDSTGRIVDGAVAERVMATEAWTFLRVRGGHWLLSAIQQAR